MMQNRGEQQETGLSGAALREAALSYLARFSATQKGLEKVLRRKIQRWQHASIRQALREGDEIAVEHIEEQTQRLYTHIKDILTEMVRLGAVNDREYTRTRLLNLPRTGRSQRAIKQHLHLKGIEPDLVQDVLEEQEAAQQGETLTLEEQECAAALVLLRKRRLGPFARVKIGEDMDEKDVGRVHDQQMRQKVFQVLARAGFSQRSATEAMNMTREEAEEHIIQLRSL